jgi:hypothetical protein
MRLAPAILVVLSAIALAPRRRRASTPTIRWRASPTAGRVGRPPEDVGLFYDIAFDLFATSRATGEHQGAKREHDRRGARLELVHQPHPAAALVLDELVRGPNTGAPPNPERWVLIREKSAGASAGFTAKDANGETWFLSFDRPARRRGHGAMVVASKIFWALGYNQVETFITTSIRAR